MSVEDRIEHTFICPTCMHKEQHSFQDYDSTMDFRCEGWQESNVRREKMICEQGCAQCGQPLMRETMYLMQQEQDKCQTISRGDWLNIMNKGPKEFKAFCDAHSSVTPNLADFDFIDIDLDGIDFTGCDLSGCKFTGNDMRETFIGQYRQKGVEYSSGMKFVNTNFDDCNMAYTSLRGADFSNASMVNVDLQGAVIAEAVFKDADLTGADLRYSPYSTWFWVGEPSFQGANLTLTNMSGVDCREISMAGATLVKVNFRGANFSQKQLKGHTLSGSNFREANLSEVVLERCIAVGCKFVNADMRKAMLINIQFDGSDFQNVNLDGAHLSGCSFKECNFENASLLNVEIDNCDFEGANMASVKACGDWLIKGA